MSSSLGRIASYVLVLSSVFLVLIILVLPSAGAGQEGPVSLNPEQAKDARALKSEVMAPCCWNGTVDLHNSPAARAVANEIDRWVSQGVGRQEILDRLAGEYGERILAKPRTSGFGLFFYVGPALATLVGGVFVSRWLKRNVGKVEVKSDLRPISKGGSGWDRKFEESLEAMDS